MSQHDITVKVADCIAAVTVTDLQGEGAADRVRDALEAEFAEVDG